MIPPKAKLSRPQAKFKILTFFKKCQLRIILPQPRFFCSSLQAKFWPSQAKLSCCFGLWLRGVMRHLITCYLGYHAMIFWYGFVYIVRKVNGENKTQANLIFYINNDNRKCIQLNTKIIAQKFRNFDEYDDWSVVNFGKFLLYKQ